MVAPQSSRPREGYGHSFAWHKQPGFAELQRCAERMGPLLAARAALVHVYAGDELDLFSDRTVLLAFNGVGAGAGQPFVFPGNANPGEIFQALTATNVCETGKKPYDEVVTAALIVARECFAPDILEIGSDGTWAKDWAAGKALAEKVLAHSVSNPLSREGGRKAARGDER